MKDIFGMICSALCILHCSLAPLLLLLGVSSVGLGLFEQEWIHLALAAPMFILAAISFPKSYTLHKNIVPLVMGALGVALMAASIVGPHEYESYFAVSAGITLIAAHFINRKLLAKLYDADISNDPINSSAV